MSALEWYNKLARMAEDDKRLGTLEYRQIQIIAEFIAKELEPEDGVCPRRGQFPNGQTGEYPCPGCGLPLLHDVTG